MQEHGFVEDGRQRAVDGIREEVRLAVEAEYAGQLEEAGPLRRAFLKLRMSREINRRVRLQVEKKAPRGGLYLR